jgi:hypothetical protein
VVFKKDRVPEKEGVLVKLVLEEALSLTGQASGKASVPSRQAACAASCLQSLSTSTCVSFSTSNTNMERRTWEDCLFDPVMPGLYHIVKDDGMLDSKRDGILTSDGFL